MSDTNCPYCKVEIEINHDDGYGYQDNELYEQQCPICDKVFSYTISTLFYYATYQAACLNGGEHELVPVVH